MMQSIEDFFLDARNAGSVCFDALYNTLTRPECSIGLRRGLIPIYLAAAMHEYKDRLLITNKFGQVALTADTLLQINADPAAFTLSYIDWDPEKETFMTRMLCTFH